MPSEKPPGDDCPKCGHSVIEYQHMDEGFARWACHHCRATGQMPAFELTTEEPAS